VANHLGLKFCTVSEQFPRSSTTTSKMHTTPAPPMAAAAVANPDADTGASMTTLCEFHVSSTSSLKIVGLPTDPQLQPRGSRHQPTDCMLTTGPELVDSLAPLGGISGCCLRGRVLEK